jgi:hypothetical protein
MVVSDIDFSTSTVSLAVILVVSSDVVLGVSGRSVSVEGLSIVRNITTSVVVSNIDFTTSTVSLAVLLVVSSNIVLGVTSRTVSIE